MMNFLRTHRLSVILFPTMKQTLLLLAVLASAIASAEDIRLQPPKDLQNQAVAVDDRGIAWPLVEQAGGVRIKTAVV